MNSSKPPTNVCFLVWWLATGAWIYCCLMNSVTFKSTLAERNCCFRSSLRGKSAQVLPWQVICPSASGDRCSRILDWLRRLSTESRSTRTSLKPAPTPTGSAHPRPPRDGNEQAEHCHETLSVG